MDQLIDDQDQLKHEVEELTVRLSGKDAEIVILKAELLTAQTEGPGTFVVQALERENAELRAKVIALQENSIKDNDAANDLLTLIISPFLIDLPLLSLSQTFPVSSLCGLSLCRSIISLFLMY